MKKRYCIGIICLSLISCCVSVMSLSFAYYQKGTTVIDENSNPVTVDAAYGYVTRTFKVQKKCTVGYSVYFANNSSGDWVYDKMTCIDGTNHWWQITLTVKYNTSFNYKYCKASTDDSETNRTYEGGAIWDGNNRTTVQFTTSGTQTDYYKYQIKFKIQKDVGYGNTMRVWGDYNSWNEGTSYGMTCGNNNYWYCTTWVATPMDSTMKYKYYYYANSTKYESAQDKTLTFLATTDADNEFEIDDKQNF